MIATTTTRTAGYVYAASVRVGDMIATPTGSTLGRVATTTRVAGYVRLAFVNPTADGGVMGSADHYTPRTRLWRD